MKYGLIVLVVLIAAIAGYLSIPSMDESEFLPVQSKSEKRSSQNQKVLFITNEDIVETRQEILVDEEAQSVEKVMHGERLLHFQTDAEYQSFLRKAHAEGLQIIGSIDQLKLVRVRFRKRTKESDFLARFEDVEFISENDQLMTPQPLMPTSSVGFKSDPLAFLGISSTEGWGKGIKIAVIDSGVLDHRSFPGKITHIDLIGGVDDEVSYHGTAVASLIAGNSNHIKGIAPASEILDIRALRNDGGGDAFTVAHAIVVAVENGARIINLSLGTSQDNAALSDAVFFAQDSGAIVVAAVGNEGQGKVSYPAAYEGVVGVGAVDAYENYQSFSNRGPEVDVVAPGVELKAAGINESIIYFTGTSAAAPLVSATLAYQLSSNPQMTNEEAIEILKINSNDAGPPGGDNFYGEGILNVGRIVDDSSDVNDFAAAGFYLEPIPASNSFKLTFSGENRGNLDIGEAELLLSYPGFESSYPFYGVEKGQTVYDFIEIPADSRLLNGDFEIRLKVRMNGIDQNTANNFKSARINLQNSGQKSQ